LIATYSAIGLTMPKFQWTYVGAFMANQVREQLLIISLSAKTGVMGGAVIGMSSAAVGDHLIGTLIKGQLGVVTDIGSLALTYKQIGSGILEGLDRNSDVYRAFQSQIRADATGSAAEGLAAAKLLGVREQTALQGMWEDPILKKVTKGMQFFGLVDTTIHTPIGGIAAPRRDLDVTRVY
jgi:hypothetical protein